MKKLALALTMAAMAAPMPVAVPLISATPAAAQSSYHGRVWRDSHGRLRCHRKNGTLGLVIGGAGGALVGNAISHGTTGTIVGAAAGALLGRHVARHSSGYRCR